MILDTNSKKLISVFQSAGFKAYAVGGCVRDSIMDLPFSDVDIAVSCTPDVTESVLTQNDIRFYETGLRHGTVTAVVDGKPYEITTFRTESGYADNRHPDSVSFVTDIESDLSRRDFTINAMAYNDADGVVDIFGGRDDINAKLIRAVGDADLRFNEDALRILRALRFSATLDFAIEKSTAASILKNKNLIKNVARERITEELKKLICGIGACRVITDYYEVFNVIFDADYDEKQYFAASKIISSMPLDVSLRLAALFKTLEPDFAKIKKSVVLSNEQLDRIKNIYNCTFEYKTLNKKKIKRIMSEIGYAKAFDVFAFHKNAAALRYARQILDNGEPYLLSHLAINGDDLLKNGFVGKEIKLTLQKALDAVIDEKIENTKENILDYVLKK